MGHDVHQLSVCAEWYSPWDVPEFVHERRFDRCADCLAQLPLEERMELEWKPNPDMVWVGEGWLVLRRERHESVMEYMYCRDKAHCPGCCAQRERSQLARQWRLPTWLHVKRTVPAASEVRFE